MVTFGRAKPRPLDDWCRDIELPSGRLARVTLYRNSCPVVGVGGFAPTEAENALVRQVLAADPIYTKLAVGFPARTPRKRQR